MARIAKKKSLSNFVYKEIKNKILSNEFIPGDKLIESDLANEMGVSRTPIREALIKLSEEGLVEAFPRKSFIVSKISLKEAKDLYTLRKALEPVVIEEIAKEGITEKNKNLLKILEDMKSFLDNEDLRNLEKSLINWSYSVINLSENNHLKESLYEINTKLYRFSNYLSRDRKNIKDAFNSVNAIFNAIKQQNPDLAYQLSREYISNIYYMLEKESDYKSFRN